MRCYNTGWREHVHVLDHAGIVARELQVTACRPTGEQAIGYIAWAAGRAVANWNGTTDNPPACKGGTTETGLVHATAPTTNPQLQDGRAIWSHVGDFPSGRWYKAAVPPGTNGPTGSYGLPEQLNFGDVRVPGKPGCESRPGKRAKCGRRHRPALLAHGGGRVLRYSASGPTARLTRREQLGMDRGPQAGMAPPHGANASLPRRGRLI